MTMEESVMQRQSGSQSENTEHGYPGCRKLVSPVTALGKAEPLLASLSKLKILQSNQSHNRQISVDSERQGSGW